MVHAPFSPAGAFDRSIARVMLALTLEVTPFAVVLLGSGCLPQEDLSSYSRAWESRAREAERPDAADDGALGADAAAHAAGSASAPSGAGSADAGDTADAGDAVASGADAGTASSALDAGAQPDRDASTGSAADAASAPP